MRRFTIIHIWPNNINNLIKQKRHPTSHEIRRFARLAGEITDLCQTFVKLRTYTRIYTREMCLSRVDGFFAGIVYGGVYRTGESLFTVEEAFSIPMHDLARPLIPRASSLC